MKKILAILVLVFFSTMSFAQWSAGPGNLYMTGGNVGIGITAPTNDIQVTDAAGPATIVLNTTVVPTGSSTYNLCQYDMRWNGTTGEFYRNVLRRNMANSHTEMLQTLRNGSGATMNFLWVDLNDGKFEMQSGISDATFKNNGNVYFINGATAGAGAVGIGMTQGAITTPIPAGAKLAVGGKVVCKEIEVTLTGMPLPDFVFNSDYNLKSLYEVENFINLNKHLPDVPSAKEVTANGMNLGDMNATLLLKVEELTLYMIDLKKENDALKSRVNNLEK